MISAARGSKPDPDSDPAQVVRGDPAQQRLLRRWLLVGIVAIVLTWLLFRYWGTHANPYALLHRLYDLAYLCGLGLLAAAWYSVRYARRVFAATQYPPPGGWVLGPTRVRRGSAARRIGVEILICAAALAVLGGYALYLPHSIDIGGRPTAPIQMAPQTIAIPVGTSPPTAPPHPTASPGSKAKSVPESTGKPKP
ncbi:MAG: hypothetical protein JSS41_03615 [Proteobacteria bacterium]|nr:hypothetical protein [Pseudomonadota bacterium]MBS0464549.1 hypothetical protein [Pseudomonadota bacterium]